MNMNDMSTKEIVRRMNEYQKEQDELKAARKAALPFVECFYCEETMHPHHNSMENMKTLKCPCCHHEVILHVQ